MANGIRPSIDETLMTCPVPRSLKWGSTSCIPYSADLTLTCITSSMSSSVSCEGRRVIPWPTLFTQTSIRPNWPMASRTTRCTSSRRVMSATTMSAWAPQVSATARRTSARLATRTTDAPREARGRASAAPMPLLAPVMTTTAWLWDGVARTALIEPRLVAASDPFHQIPDHHVPVVSRIVDGNDALHIEPQPIDGLHEVGRVRADARGRRRIGLCRWIERVRFDEDFLLGEVRNDQPLVVAAAAKMMQLDDVVAIGHDFLLGDRFKLRRLFLPHQPIRLQRVRQRKQLFEVGFVHFVGHDCGAFGHERPQAARVVDVMMGVHDVANRLVRNQPFRFGDDLRRAGFALRPFDHDDVVLKVHGHGRVAAQNQEYSVRQLLGWHAGCGSSRCAPSRWRTTTLWS